MNAWMSCDEDYLSYDALLQRGLDGGSGVQQHDSDDMRHRLLARRLVDPKQLLQESRCNSGATILQDLARAEQRLGGSFYSKE